MNDDVRIMSGRSQEDDSSTGVGGEGVVGGAAAAESEYLAIEDDDDNNDDGFQKSAPYSSSSSSSWIDKLRSLAGRVVDDRRFEGIILTLILLNGVVMGLGTFDFVTDNEEVDEVFDILDQRIFIAIFTLELTLQLVHKGLSVFTDGWFIFDVIVVVTSWAFSTFSIVRSFRIFRAFRMFTKFLDVRDLVNALAAVLARIGAISVIMMVVYYVFAVIFTSLFKDLYEDGLTSQDYFSRLDVTFFTLFQIMTLDDWSAITREVMVTHPWAWFPFSCYVLITTFIVINLVVSIICQALGEGSDQEEPPPLKQQQQQQQQQQESALDMQQGVSTSTTTTVSQQDFVRLERKIDLLLARLDQQQQQDRATASNRTIS